MESPGGAFLQQISLLKHQIDQMNYEIEAEVRRTRVIESAIVQCSEKEQVAMDNVEKCTRSLSQRENQLSDLSAVADATEKDMAESEAELQQIEMIREELCLDIEKQRDAFIASCKSFQLHDHRIVNFADSTASKFDLLSELESVKKEVKCMEYADNASYDNRMARLRMVQKGITELQNEINAENGRNENLLRRIDDLNDTLTNVPEYEDIIRLEEDYNIGIEEKMNLEDGIFTLQQQLPFLLSQEKEFANLLANQQRALESLEQKIEEVKLLQEAFENDSDNNMLMEQTTKIVEMNTDITAQDFIPDRVFTLVSCAPECFEEGSWGRYQKQ